MGTYLNPLTIVEDDNVPPKDQVVDEDGDVPPEDKKDDDGPPGDQEVGDRSALDPFLGFLLNRTIQLP